MAGPGDFLKSAFISWFLGGGLFLAIIIYFLFFR